MNRERQRPMHWPFQKDMPEPSLLDRMADQELAVGRTAQAERLAHEAEMLREAGQ